MTPSTATLLEGLADTLLSIESLSDMGIGASTSALLHDALSVTEADGPVPLPDGLSSAGLADTIAISNMVSTLFLLSFLTSCTLLAVIFAIFGDVHKSMIHFSVFADSSLAVPSNSMVSSSVGLDWLQSDLHSLDSFDARRW